MRTCHCKWQPCRAPSLRSARSGRQGCLAGSLQSTTRHSTSTYSNESHKLTSEYLSWLTFRLVRFEGVRSAEPPMISGSAAAMAFKTSSEWLRVPTAFISCTQRQTKQDVSSLMDRCEWRQTFSAGNRGKLSFQPAGSSPFILLLNSPARYGCAEL